MWTYRQASGTLDHDGLIIGVGYSGAGKGKNIPSMQNVLGVGPIPCGMYSIGEPFTHPHAGPLTMRLLPHSTNNMFGRSGFMMHGDNADHTASEGCIIMPHEVRAAVAESSDKSLVVAV